MSAVTDLRDEPTVANLELRIAELEKQISDFHAHNAALEWKRMYERFHCFDAIKSDACPCCGGRVRVIEESVPPSIRLESTHGVVVPPSSGLQVWGDNAKQNNGQP